MVQTNRAKALRLRRQGLDIDAIAHHIGCARSTVSGYLTQALDELAADGIEDAEAVRRLELSRLDGLQHAVYKDAMGGDPKSVEAVLKIMDRRSKLLGLDKTAKGPINLVQLNVEELVSQARQLGVEIPVALLAHETGGEGYGDGVQPGRERPDPAGVNCSEALEGDGGDILLGLPEPGGDR